MSLNFPVTSQVKIQNEICAKRNDLKKFHISHVDKTRWHLNPRAGRNKDPVLMAGWQRERERDGENSGKVKQMALAFDFPDGCPDW